MSFWNDEQLALQQSARAFVEKEVAPHLQSWEDAGEVPRGLHAAAAKKGFLGLGYSVEIGGSGGTFLDALALTEAMAEAGSSSGLLAALFTSGIALPHIVASGNRDLVDRFVRPTLAGETIGSLAVTEPGGGSDVANIRTTASRAGDHYVLNGAKTFITSGVRADFVTTAVRTGGPGYGGLSLLVVEKGTPGFEVTRTLSKTGWHLSDTAELSFVDCHVPVTNLVGEEVVQHRLVEMHRRVEVARTYTREVARRYVAGETPVAEACLAKSTAVEACSWVVDQAVQLHGGTGYMHGIEVERHYRDARILPIGGGATEVLGDLAARLLGYVS